GSTGSTGSSGSWSGKNTFVVFFEFHITVDLFSVINLHEVFYKRPFGPGNLMGSKETQPGCLEFIRIEFIINFDVEYTDFVRNNSQSAFLGKRFLEWLNQFAKSCISQTENGVIGFNRGNVILKF